MEDHNKEDLLIELAVINTMITENPCGLKESLFSSLKDVIKSIIGTHCIKGATREQVAKYFGRDVRTLSHWREKFPDFPTPKKDFASNKTYNWMEVIEFKLKHPELFQK